ncbi:hypothetical protein EV424DRAFT_1541838 [Suillus variegatus]|nr:hypothetical protein EV424DRAFT_1541838 [Suillus variegatus]
MAGAIGRSSVGKRGRIYLVKRGKSRAHCALRGKAAPHIGIAAGSIQSDAASRAVYSLVKTAISHNVRHESLQRVVLPDKKFGCTRLVCANCDLMKVTCAIDGVGMRMRMQAKVATASLNSAEHSGMRIQKSHVISPIILNIAEEAQQQPGLPADVPMKTLAIISTSQWPEQGDQFVPTNRADPEPTARDILQGIQDLGRRFDLLATNERVDTLDVRVRSVETILHQRLDTLEQHLNASDAW